MILHFRQAKIHYRLWLHCTPAQSAWTGFSFGLGFFGFGVNRVFVTLTLTQMPILLSVLLWLFFCSLLALFPTLAGWLQSKSSAKPIIRLLILMPSMMLLMDWIRAWLFTGFPWLVVGYTTTSCKWCAKYSGLDVSIMSRLKQLEAENMPLKKMYAEERLEGDLLKEILGNK